ncbi:putative plasmid protein, partial [Candidatus Burkholderia humilis]
RRTRLGARADLARSASKMTYTRAKVIASDIPFGQPILCGHHFERRDRNYRGLIHNTFGKVLALHDQAKELGRRAIALGKSDLSSDDPEAIGKLRAKLAELEELHERMTHTNALIRRNDYAGLEQMGYTASAITNLFRPDYRGRAGFASYELTNIGTNIRYIRDRILASTKGHMTDLAVDEPSH